MAHAPLHEARVMPCRGYVLWASFCYQIIMNNLIYNPKAPAHQTRLKYLYCPLLPVVCHALTLLVPGHIQSHNTETEHGSQFNKNRNETLGSFLTRTYIIQKRYSKNLGRQKSFHIFAKG